MLKDDYLFMDCKIAKENIGEHDADNRFITAGVKSMMRIWQKEHPGCTPIGVCYDDSEKKYSCYRPMVYVDENGDRFYTHINISAIKEYLELEEKEFEEAEDWVEKNYYSDKKLVTENNIPGMLKKAYIAGKESERSRYD